MARVLIVNPSEPRCGVYQFGAAVHSILKKSTRHTYWLNSGDIYDASHFDAIIFNYHEKLFPWLNDEAIKAAKIPCFAIGGHDCYPNFSELRAVFNCDSTSKQEGKNIPLPRPVKKFDPLPDPEIVTIGSCGFDFSSKNFQHVATVVAQSFDEAKIRLHIPHHPGGEGIGSIEQTIRQQLWSLNKPKISVEISQDFLTDNELIAFLSANTANVFLYPPFHGQNRGLSSVIDKALSARKPIAISDSTMYRHISHESKFLLSRHSLREIISFGTKHFAPILEEHSEERLIKIVDEAIDQALCC